MHDGSKGVKYEVLAATAIMIANVLGFKPIRIAVCIAGITTKPQESLVNGKKASNNQNS